MNISKTRINSIIRPIIRCKGNKKNLISKYFSQEKVVKLSRYDKNTTFLSLTTSPISKVCKKFLSLFTSKHRLSPKIPAEEELDVVNGIVERKTWMSVIVEIVDRGNAQITATVGVDKSTAKDEIHVEVFDILPQNARRERFSMLIFVAYGRGKTGRKQPMTRGHPVVCITKGKSPLTIGNAGDAKCFVDAGTRSKDTEEGFSAISIEGDVLLIKAQPNEP